MAKLENKAGQGFTLIPRDENAPMPPKGTWLATCINIVDKFGVERPVFEGEGTELQDLTQLEFGFRDKDGQPHKIATRTMKISGNEKSNLFQFLRGWLGEAPRMGWDYMEMKGKKALITIEHATSGRGTVYATIASISPVPEGFGEAPATPPPAASAKPVKAKPAPKPPAPVETDDVVPF